MKILTQTLVLLAFNCVMYVTTLWLVHTWLTNGGY